MITSADANEGFDEVQHPFIIKKYSEKTRIKGKFPILTKAIS